MRAFLFASIVALLLVPADARSQRDDRQRIDTTLAFEKGGVVNLGHVSGDIVVNGWTKLEAKVYAVIATGYLDATLTASRIEITARTRRNRMGMSHYELWVPIGTEVRASTISGNVAVRGSAGDVRVSTVSGDIEVRNAMRTEIGTTSGDVHVERLTGPVRVRTTSGNVTLDSVTGDLRGKSVSGTMRVRGALSGLEFESISGDFEFRGDFVGTGTFAANTHSGNMRLTLPDNLAANLELRTFSGEMRTEFPLTLQPGAQVGRRTRELQTTINGGGARVRLGTFSGDITIRKGAARPTKED